MPDERVLNIFFTDGSDMTLTFPEQGGNPHLLAKRVQSALDAKQLAIEIDNDLLVIPTNNIKYMRVSPGPEMLPETVILGGAIKTAN